MSVKVDEFVKLLLERGYNNILGRIDYNVYYKSDIDISIMLYEMDGIVVSIKYLIGNAEHFSRRIRLNCSLEQLGEFIDRIEKVKAAINFEQFYDDN